MIEEAISKMELQPQEEEVEEFAWDFPSMNKNSNNNLLLTADEVGKVPVVVVKDGLEVLDKFLNNIFHHCASVLMPCPFAKENLRR